VSRERPFDQPIPLPDGLPIEPQSTAEPATGLRRLSALWPWVWLALMGVATLGWMIGLGRRRARSMAYWLEDLEILDCFHCSANDHAPKGDVDLKCKQHLNSPVSSDF
jgi:hypothetical protein